MCPYLLSRPKSNPCLLPVIPPVNCSLHFLPSHNFPCSPRVPPVLCFVYFSMSSLFFPCPMSSLVPFSFSPFRIIFFNPFTNVPYIFCCSPALFQQTYHTTCPFHLPVTTTCSNNPHQSSSCRRASPPCIVLYCMYTRSTGRLCCDCDAANNTCPNPRVPRNLPQGASF